MRRDLSAKYDLRVPRYTSYPTAPHFHPGIDGGQYGRWLAGLDPATELSLYLHIAYCAEMCWFCGCHTKITRRYAPVATYLEALLAEVRMVADHLPAPMAARHIHFGGGSPTILSAEDFVRTLDTLRRHFLVKPDAEIAVELDPRTADEAYVRAMAGAGVTRASIGVQDFDPKVQEAINRIQPYDVTARVVDWLRRHGVPEINMDLVYGLPYQSVDGLLDTVDKAHGFAPRRIALFGYAHVPWMKKHQRLIPEEALPDTDTRWLQYERATARLEDLGYVKIGLDHFAAPDDPLAVALRDKRLHRNFQGYTTDTAEALIGFGASGIGSLPPGYVANVSESHGDLASIIAGLVASSRGIALDGDDPLRRDLIMTLMCDLELDVEAVCARHGADAGRFDADLARLAPMVADGLAEVKGRRIAMTDEGRTLVRAAAAIFDKYLKTGEQRHSKAV